MRWALVALLLLPLQAWAADGDLCPDAYTSVDNSDGDYTERCYLLCDTKDSNATSCAPFVVQTPSILKLEIGLDLGCSADATATIMQSGSLALNSHPYLTLSRLDTDGGGEDTGDTAAVLEGAAESPLGVLETTLSTMTGCTNFTVILRALYKKRYRGR